MSDTLDRLPKAVKNAVLNLSKACEQSNMPIFCLLPAYSNPILLKYANKNDPFLSYIDQSFTELLYATHYYVISRMNYKPEIIDGLRIMKGIDKNFDNNALKYMAQGGLSRSVIEGLIIESKASPKVDYSFSIRNKQKTKK